MAKDNTIIIDNFQVGMTSSSALGYPEMVGIDITTRPGYARVNPKLKKDSGTTITDRPNWMKKGDATSSTENYIYVLDNSGNLWERDNTGTWTEVTGTSGSSGTGLGIYKGFLHDIEGQTLYVYNLSTSSWVASPYGSTYSLQGGSGVETLKGQDNIFYLAANEAVGSIKENDGETLDPTDSDTYTVKINAATPALDLPDGHDSTGISALGDDIMVSANNTETNESDIFPWDRVATSFELPARLGLNDIHAQVTTENQVFVIAGVEGTIYRSNGVSIVPINKLSDEVINRGLDKSVYIEPDAICIFKNLIFFATSYNGSTGNTTPAYIWSLNPRTGAINIEHTISNGETGTGSGNVIIGSMIPLSDTELLVGYEDTVNSVKGVDILDTTRRYTDYSAYILSRMYRVGTHRAPKTFNSVEVELSKELASGEGVKIEYRKNKSDSWAEIGTLDTAGKQSEQFDFGKDRFTTVQFKISMTTPSGSESTPELISVTIN